MSLVLLLSVLVFAATGDPIYAPDPGDPPANAQTLNPIVLLVGILVFTAGLLFAVSAHARGKIRRKTLFILTAVILLMSWSGLLIAMINAPPNDDYKEWEEAHRMWKNKEIIGREE